MIYLMFALMLQGCRKYLRISEAKGLEYSAFN